MTVSSSLGIAASVGFGGVTGVVTITPPRLNARPFSTLPLDLPRTMRDDCVLCDAFRLLGGFPSQNGGAWTGHPTPAWPGPLTVYPRNPGIPSGSLCRGACGPNCDTCGPPEDLIVCERLRGGKHRYWLYPGYQVCNTHDGCRQHDAAYDWCAAGGELSMWGPCHRVADFECVCDHGGPRCVGWAGGDPPPDGQMAFSEKPRVVARCEVPCPKESISPSGVKTYRVCLPKFVLLDRAELFSESYSDATGEIILYSEWLTVPYIQVPVLVTVFAQGDMAASADGGAGPVWLSDMCLDVDPLAGVYHGSAQLNASIDVGAALAVSGEVGARAGWGCLFPAIVEAAARLTALGDARATTTLSARVDVSCRDGQVVLDAAALLKLCLDLMLRLEATLRLELFTFTIISHTWELARRSWGRCWNTTLGVISLPVGGGVDTDYDINSLTARHVVETALGDAVQDRRLLEALTEEPDDYSADGEPGPGPSPEEQMEFLMVPGGSTQAGTTASGGLTIPADPAPAVGEDNPCPVGPIVTPTIVFDKSEFPQIAPHIHDTIHAQSRPSRLHREANKSEIRKHRRIACGPHRKAKKPGSCDEYPFASSKEGGANALTKGVPLSEQNKQGGKLSAFYQKHQLKDNNAYDVDARI
jgi:hypothetical protein